MKLRKLLCHSVHHLLGPPGWLWVPQPRGRSSECINTKYFTSAKKNSTNYYNHFTYLAWLLGCCNLNLQYLSIKAKYLMRRIVSTLRCLICSTARVKQYPRQPLFDVESSVLLEWNVGGRCTFVGHQCHMFICLTRLWVLNAICSSALHVCGSSMPYSYELVCSATSQCFRDRWTLCFQKCADGENPPIIRAPAAALGRTVLHCNM
jgi:hypothetical protein